jgi:hypothetical protein
MSCLVPGHVIVAAREGSIDNIIGMLSEHSRTSLDVVYSIEDVLEHYHLGDSVRDIEKRLGPLPFVVRVPEGEEMALATLFAQMPQVRSSFPDFLVRPVGANFDINAEAISDALRFAGLDQADPQSGESIKVAILDTGVDPDQLVSPNSLFPEQFNAQMREFGPEAIQPGDKIGHGTLVAYIINRIVPAASLMSVKTMADSGTIGSVLAGLYLAEARFQPNIFNLSLTIRCDEEVCPICQSPQSSTMNSRQLKILFNGLARGGIETPVFVGAAGNNSSRVGMPAIFPGFIAVGACDVSSQQEADYSRYESVPQDRYILAPGGGNGGAGVFGHRTSLAWDRRPTLFGTSFAAAFVTGAVARFLSLRRGWATRRRLGRPGGETDTPTFALNCLALCSDRSWAGFKPSRHGLGILRWQSTLAESLRQLGQDGGILPERQTFVVLDTTGSMHGYLSAVANHIEAMPENDHTKRTLRLVLFGDHEDKYTVYPYRVSSSSEEIAMAVRAAPLTEGGDDPEALEDALHLVATEIECMHVANTEVIVFTDNRPHNPEECPNGYDFIAELKRLRSLNVRVEIVSCGGDLGWMNNLPMGISACRFPDHEWSA